MGDVTADTQKERRENQKEEESMLRDLSPEDQELALKKMAQMCPKGCHLGGMTVEQEYITIKAVLHDDPRWQAAVNRVADLKRATTDAIDQGGDFGPPTDEHNDAVLALHRLWDGVRNRLGLRVYYTTPDLALEGSFNLEPYQGRLP